MPGTGFLSRISYTLRNFAALPSLAYFLAISVSICAKLARSILMRPQHCNRARLSTILTLILYWIHASNVHEKVHDNVRKRYSDKTMLTMKTKLLQIKQAPVNKRTFIGSLLEVHWGKT